MNHLIFRYTRCVVPKHVTSLRAHLYIIAPVDNTAPFEENVAGWRTVDNTASDYTDARFEPQISRFRDERVATPLSAWPFQTL